MNEKINYQLVYAKRKSIGISIKNDGSVVVRAPKGIKKAYIQKVVQDKAEWIIENQLKVLERSKDRDEGLKEGQILYLLGEPFQLQIKVVKSKRGIEIEGNKITTYTSEKLEKEIEALLEVFYRREAKCYLTERVNEFSNVMNVTYGRISIKNQKTRWGSCSGKGNLNFNWKIIMAPKMIIDYLVVHELTHRKEMNHSKKFYAEMKKVLPDYKICQDWLKENGKYLSLYSCSKGFEN